MAHRKHAKGKFWKKLMHPFDIMLSVALAPGKLAAFAPIMPLVPVMEGALKRKGVKVPGNKLDHLENLTHQFLKVIVFKEAPLTKGVGLADKHNFEHVGGEEEDENEEEIIYDDAPGGYIDSSNDGGGSGGGSGSGSGMPYTPIAPNTNPISAVNQAVSPSAFPNLNGLLHHVVVNPKYLQTHAITQSSSAANTQRHASGGGKYQHHRKHTTKHLGRRHFEHADGEEEEGGGSPTPSGSGSGSGTSKAQGYAEAAKGIMAIIKKIIAFIHANKKKTHEARTGVPAVLTEEEKQVAGNTPPDHEMTADSDKVQDKLVASGVGDIKSDDTHQHTHEHEVGWFEELWDKITGRHPDEHKK